MPSPTDSARIPRPRPETAAEPILVSAAAIGRALDVQRRLFDATGRWLRLGEVLLLRGEIAEADAEQLLGSALFPGERSGRPEAEFLGEIALRRNLVTVPQFCSALESQESDRRARRPHKLIATILVERGHLHQKDLLPLEEDLHRDMKLRQDEGKRAAEDTGERAALTPVDAQYLRAARKGDMSPAEILSALQRLKRIQRLVGRRIALWEDLVAREVVAPDQHLRVLDQTVNVRGEGETSWLVGGIIVELGYAAADEVASALDFRETEGARLGKPPRPVGEILIEREVVTRSEIGEALRIQTYRRQGGARRARLGQRRRRGAVAVVVALAVGAAFASYGWPAIQWRRAAATLGAPGATVEARTDAVAALLADPRIGTAEAIARTYDDASVPAPVRMACLRALADMGASSAPARVRASLSDEAPGLRILGAWIVADKPDPATRAALRARLVDSDVVAGRVAAARALATLGETAGREALVLALKPDRLERRRIAAELGMTEPAVRGAIVASLETLSGFKLGDRYERWEAWLALQPLADEVLGKTRGPAVVARLQRLLDDGPISVRFCAARALAHAGDPRGIPLLVRAIDRDDRSFRAALLNERAMDVDKLGPEIASLLALLTGRSFGQDAAAWKAWLVSGDGAGAERRP